MQEKYNLSCIAVNDYLYPKFNAGFPYYKVWLRSADDPNGEKLREKAGQDYLDYIDVNDAQKWGSAFAVYIDATKGHNLSVIGDQYMWYTVYPLFNEWMNEQLSQYAVCQPMCRYLFFSMIDCEWAFDYCFPPDFPLLTGKDELEDILPMLQVQVRAFYPESLNITTTQNDWNSFQEILNENTLFRYFGMKIYEVPNSVYEVLDADEMNFRRIGLTKYPSWTIWLKNAENDEHKNQSVDK